MSQVRPFAFAWAFAGLVAVVLATGCPGGPKYPSCDNDEQCTSEVRKGVCVDHKCVACRDNDGCGAGKECRENACVAIEGYCADDGACGAGSACGADHRCHAQKTAASEPTECDDDHPCSSGGRCQNGHCVAPPRGGPGCTDFPAPKFDYESPEVRAESKEVLQRLAGCLLTGTLKDASVLLVGHCDARGENEFNMGLGAERAEAVKTFLKSLGVPRERVATSSRGKLDAVGTDEDGYQNDRRVDVEVR